MYFVLVHNIFEKTDMAEMLKNRSETVSSAAVFPNSTMLHRLKQPKQITKTKRHASINTHR